MSGAGKSLRDMCRLKVPIVKLGLCKKLSAFAASTIQISKYSAIFTRSIDNWNGLSCSCCPCLHHELPLTAADNDKSGAYSKGAAFE